MFQYKTYLPVSEQEVYSSQLTYREYFSLIKTIQNADSVKIDEALTNVMSRCTGDPDLVSTLTGIDRLALLINIRIMSISDHLELVISGQDTGERKNVKVDLYDVLDKLTNNEYVYTVKTRIAKGVSAILTVPSSLSLSTDKLVIYDTIKSLNIGSQTFDFTEMSRHDRDGLLDELPASATAKLRSGVDKLNKFEVEVIKDVPGEPGGSLLTIRLFDDSAFETLKLIYNSSLQDQYTLRYILSKRCNMSCEYLDELPPTDVNTYYALYKKELAEEKKAHEAANSRNSMQLPVTPPMS